MIVYNKKQRLRRHYGGGGIFDSIARIAGRVAGNELVRKAAAEAGKKVVETTAKKVGDVVGEKIVSGIKKLRKQSPKAVNSLKTLTADNLAIIQSLTTPKSDINISNILAGSGQAIAIEKLTRKLNKKK